MDEGTCFQTQYTQKIFKVRPPDLFTSSRPSRDPFRKNFKTGNISRSRSVTAIWKRPFSLQWKRFSAAAVVFFIRFENGLQIRNPDLFLHWFDPSKAVKAAKASFAKSPLEGFVINIFFFKNCKDLKFKVSAFNSQRPLSYDQKTICGLFCTRVACAQD